MKRPSTYSALVLLTSGLVLTAPLVVHPGPIRAESDRTFTIDVAEDCRTGVVNSANPHEDTSVVNSVGDTLIVAGTIYPGGTLHSGTQNNSPDDPGSIGEWRSRATLLANWNGNTNLFDGSPIAFATMLYSLNNGRDSLVSEGLVPNVGLSVKRAVIGGTGSFAAASGEVRHQNLGTNATACFNYRFTFKLSDKE